MPQQRITRGSFVATLKNISDLNDHYAFIDHHALQGDRDLLKAVFDELQHEGLLHRIPERAFRAVLERIIESLALTDGYDNAITALELAADADLSNKPSSFRIHRPALVSKIVAAHSPEVVGKLLLELKDLETKALVLHEAVIRRKLFVQQSILCEIQDRLSSAKHPLALQPLMLYDFEKHVILPDYRTGSSTTSIPFGPAPEQLAPVLFTLVDNLDKTETTQIERANLISSAVVKWKMESNGKIEARTFSLDLPSHDLWPAIIPKLGLESIGITTEIRARKNVAICDVFNVLFSSASSGGAYDHGSFAAYGRLLAWQSLAGLVGAPVDAMIEDIAIAAQNCWWCLFESSSEWYYQVAWDIGIACYNPGNREVAVLAASDTD